MTSTLLAVALTLGSAQAAEYKASDKEGPIKIVNLDELESQVAKNMEKGAFGYIRGGAEGVNSVIQQLNKELSINMMLGGAKNIESVKATQLYTDKDFQ